MVDKQKKQDEKEKRKKLKARRSLPKAEKSVDPSDRMEDSDNSFKPGTFVRAPAPDIEEMEDDDGLNPIKLGKGLKRQLSDDDDDSDEDLPQPLPRHKSVTTINLIAPSAFNKVPSNSQSDVQMHEDQDDWQQVRAKKKKLKSMETDDNLAQSTPQSTGSNLNPFRNRLVENLKGSRFRFINEQLYKCEGKDALKLFDEDKEAFLAYHEGYRQQVQRWPRNPLERMIKAIKKMPVSTVIADFGCGEARLAKEVPQEVKSLDLVALAPDVIACDMASTPLKDDSIDVAVYCLSLMGTNLKDFFLEANRVLKPRGTLKIAEVASRFDNVKNFVQNVEKCGFQVVNQDLGDKLFYYFNFKKTGKVSKKSKEVKDFTLKPCLYKKR